MADGQQETQLVAKHDYKAENAQELTMRKGDRLLLVDDTKEWWKVRCPDTGKEGFVPSNYVKIAKPKTSLFSNILKKHPGKKKDALTNKNSSSSSCPSPSFNGDPGSHRGLGRLNGSGGNIHGSGSAPGNVGGRGDATETYQLGQCMPASVKYPYTAQRTDEVSLVRGERLMVIEKSNDGWWRGRKDDGGVGWFPSNYVEELGTSSGSNSNNGTLCNNQDTNNSNLLYFTAAEAKSQSHSSPSHSSSDHGVPAVQALYAFTGKNSGELSCHQGERLEVVAWEPDSDWMSVRNSRGETGVVPTNYVANTSTGTISTTATNIHNATTASSGEEGSDRATSTSSSNPQSQPQSIASISNNSIAALAMAGRKQFQVSGPLAEKDWYYGKISRNQCEDLLTKYAGDGDFLIRDSESTSGHFTVSLKAPGRNKHFRVKQTNGILEIGLQKFTNLEDLIEHYTRHPIFKQESEKLYLVKPFSCPSQPDH